jgi:hypothetical protein
MKMFASDLPKIEGFHWVFLFPPPINWHHNITKMFLKVASNIQYIYVGKCKIYLYKL